MKKNPVLLTIFLLLSSSSLLVLTSTWGLYSKTSSNQTKENIQPTHLERIKINHWSSEADTIKEYGVDKNGVFFISTRLTGDAGSVILTIIDLDSFKIKEGMVKESFDSRERIVMKKAGNYYLAKSGRNYSNPAFHFQVAPHYYIPTSMPEKFKGNDLIKNQCGGLLLIK